MMNFLAPLKRVFERKPARRQVTVEDQMLARIAESYEELRESWARFYGASNTYVDPDTVNDGQLYVRPDISHDRQIAQAREVYKTATGRNIVEQRVNHIAGDEFSISIEGSSAKPSVLWPGHRRLFQQLVRRVERDGEAFVFYDRWTQKFQFIEPADVETPLSMKGDEDVKDGVLFSDPDDMTSVQGYYIDDYLYSTSQVVHVKSFLTDDTCVRGRVPLYECMKYITRYEQFLECRMRLNVFRSMIVMFRKMKNATSSDIASFISGISEGTISRPETGRQVDITKMRPGTVLTHSENMEYDFKAPDTGAGEAEVDGRSLRLHIAMFFQMAEYMLWADASNANYASTSVTQNPAVKSMMTLQGNYGDVFEKLGRMRGFDCTMEFPSLIADLGPAQTAANITLWQAGAMSLKTLRQREKLDPVEEEKNVQGEGGSGMFM